MCSSSTTLQDAAQAFDALVDRAPDALELLGVGGADPGEGLAVRAAEPLGLLAVRGPERLDLAFERPLHSSEGRVDPPPQLEGQRDAHQLEPFLEVVEIQGRRPGAAGHRRDRAFGRELAGTLLRLLAPAVPNARVSGIGASLRCGIRPDDIGIPGG
jgi:hypothetical protein